MSDAVGFNNFDIIIHDISDKDVYPGGDEAPDFVDVEKDCAGLYSVFVSYVSHYMNMLKLNDWRIETCCAPLGACRYSQMRFSIPPRLVVFALNRSLPASYANHDYMKVTALHEVLHLMLAECEWACTSFSDVSEDVRATLADNAQHAMINRLLPLLLTVGDREGNDKGV